MTLILGLTDAITADFSDKARIVLDSFTHPIPFAARREMIRQRKRDHVPVQKPLDNIPDQITGAGCIPSLKVSWGRNLSAGSLHHLRDAVKRGCPRPIEIEEQAYAEMVATYEVAL